MVLSSDLTIVFVTINAKGMVLKKIEANEIGSDYFTRDRLPKFRSRLRNRLSVTEEFISALAQYKYHTVILLNCDVCPHFLRGKSRAGFFF